MVIFDCLRSGRLSWTLVQSALHHDFATTGICALGIASRWTLRTSLLATLICCVLLFAANWIVNRRRQQRDVSKIPARGLRLSLKASSWNFTFIARRRSSGRWPRQWQCLLRVRSRDCTAPGIRRDASSPTEGVRPGIDELSPLMED
jgi:hypothetical protein